MVNISSGAGVNIDVIFVAHGGRLRGGAERTLLALILHLKENGVHPFVVLPEPGAFKSELVKHSVPHEVISQPYWAKGHHDISDYHYLDQGYENNVVTLLVKLIEKLRPKLCVTDTIVIPWLAYAAALTNTKHAWIIHEFGSIDHGLNFAIDETQVAISIDCLSDKVFCNSKATASYFSSKFTHNQKVSLLYPYVTQPPVASIASPFRHTASKLITVGQIKPSKGQRDAVEAVKILKDRGFDVQLALVGSLEDEEYVANIKDYVSINKLEDAVLFLGFQQNPASYVAHAEIVLTCSLNEAFGRVTVEGMLAKKPIIGANSAGTAEIIDDGKTGLLYKPGDVVDMASKIEDLINDPNERKRLGDQGEATAKDLYSAEACFNGFLEYMKDLDTQRLSMDISPLYKIFSEERQQLKDILNNKERQAAEYQALLVRKDEALSNILNSKSWRLLNSVRQIFFK